MLNIGDNRNFQRLSGKAFFRRKAEIGLINFGNIIMHSLDPKIERKAIYRMEGGAKRLAREDAVGQDPTYTIEGNEFNSLNLPFTMFGTKAPDLVQAASGPMALAVPAVKIGYAYELGGYVEVSAVTATKGATPLVEGTDFRVYPHLGLVDILAGGTVLDGDAVTFNFTAPAMTREVYLPFTRLKETGTLMLYEVDSPDLPALHTITYPCDLFVEKPGDAKVEDDQKFQMRARLTGAGKVLRRSDPAVVA